MPRVNYSNEVFKKTNQIVGKPGIMNPSINEEGMRHPPDNLKGGIFTTVNEPEPRWTEKPKKKEKLEEPPLDAQDEAIGRPNKEDRLAQIVQEDSVYRS